MIKKLTQDQLIQRYNSLVEKGLRGEAKYYEHQLRKRHKINPDGSVYEVKTDKLVINDDKEIDKLNIKDIDKDYKDILEVIDFNIPLRIGIFGLQGSGKSTLAKEIAYENKNKTFIFDIIGEYKEFHRFTTKNRSYPDVSIEFDNFYKKWYKKNVLDKKLHSILIIDEASRIAPNKRTLNEGLAELNDLHRHYNNTFIVIARRPSQLHTDLIELLNYIIVFKLSGINDLDRLKDINKELEKSVISLKSYEYVIYDVKNSNISYGITQG